MPCVSLCPAGVDVPGYVALVREGRYADAVRLIRKDNPMPTACAYICEHPVRGALPPQHGRRPHQHPRASSATRSTTRAMFRILPARQSTGKRVAIIGGGPSGLSCAYYLRLMGHGVTIFEEKKKLGGMLRYGIPAYRFPREKLDAEIESILSTGVEVHTGVTVGKDISFEQLHKDYDCLYVAIGAHTDKKTGIEGEDSKNVMSAVEMLRAIGDDVMPDFTGKRVVVIGGGNVAMDVTRSSVRLGAVERHLRLSPQNCGYDRASRMRCRARSQKARRSASFARRCASRQTKPARPAALWVQPQIIGFADKTGRPRPETADQPEERIPADIIVVAIGQGVEIAGFEQTGIPIRRGTFMAESSSQIDNMETVFAGGDCVTGPATAIRAIAAGKVAAANIDEQLGFHHEIRTDVEIPAPHLDVCPPRGRVNTKEREAAQRKCDFEDIECGMTHEEACAESGRCLRCDHFGYGIFKGGRTERW